MSRTTRPSDPPNIETASTEDLQKLRDEIDAELRKRAARKRTEARKQIMEIAKANEIDLAELASTKGSPRYRNPDNQFDVWNGRGRQPKWVKEQLAKGKTLADLAIS